MGAMEMGTVVYYFFCHACGGDTAAFDLAMSCPYCRAGRGEFALVAEVATQEQQRQVEQRIAELREQWRERHRHGVPGERPARRRWLRRE